MTTIITPIAAVDAIQRVPVDCWVGPSDHPAGFPNYPVWSDAAGQPVDTLAPAKIKTRLAADITKAKGDREAGKKIGRDKPTGRGDEPGKGGGKTKAGK